MPVGALRLGNGQQGQKSLASPLPVGYNGALLVHKVDAQISSRVGDQEATEPYAISMPRPQFTLISVIP